jgi:acetyl esterase
LIVCAQYDPLRDDGINYGRALASAGNEVEVRTVPGMVHSFLRAIGVSPPAKAEFDFICERCATGLIPDTLDRVDP